MLFSIILLVRSKFFSKNIYIFFVDESLTVTDEDGSILVSSSKILQQYQEIKSGLITDSGYNICKLLLPDSIVGEADVAGIVLDVLLLEDNDNTRMWLEKVLPYIAARRFI